MKLLDKLVYKDLVPQFFIGIGMFSSLYFALGPLLAASRFVSAGFPLPLVVKYMAFNLLPILGLTFPMGMLLAVLLGYGRLSSDSETVALFAGGIPFLRVAIPAAVLGLVVSGAGYVVNDPLAAYANSQILDMKENIFHQKGASSEPFDVRIPGKNDVLQAQFHVEGGFNLRARTMKDVMITLCDARGRPVMFYYARRAHPANNDIKSPDYELQDVDYNGLGGNLDSGHLAVFALKDLKIEALTKKQDLALVLNQIKGDPNAFPFVVLRRMIRDLQAAGLGRDPDVRFAEVSLWNKFALPLASLVFSLVAAPLALRPQRTSKMTGWILSLPIILVYYILYTIMSSLARGGACPPVLAAFLPDIIGLVVGVGLVWRRSVT